MLNLLIVSEDTTFIDFFEQQKDNNVFHYTHLTSALEALKIAKETEFNLILVDLNLTEIDGIEMCQILRNQPQTNKVGLILFTEKMDDYVSIAAFNAGADDCVCKPINKDVLIHKMVALHQRYVQIKNSLPQEKEENLVYQFDTNDNQKHIFSMKGQQIELANKEAQIVRLLLSKPEKVFSRDEIYGSVWGMGKHVGDRTIDVHIRNIRSKLGENFVKTVNGVGYKYIQGLI